MSEIKVASRIAKEIETIKIDTVGIEITIDHEIVVTRIVEMTDIVREINTSAVQGVRALIEDEDIETNHGVHQGKISVEDQDHHVGVSIKKNKKIEALDLIHRLKKTKFLR